MLLGVDERQVAGEDVEMGVAGFLCKSLVVVCLGRKEAICSESVPIINHHSVSREKAL